MTECERIIKEGILPESFFEEEVRCDFLVTHERKKIWAIEIELLLKLLEVCKRNGLKVWGDGGTLLGAVRHNGFIPWDDDIDVIMPREDYNKLLELGNKGFESPFFLQTPYTDPGYFYSFAKLRNSNTTAISKPFAKAGFNHGIFIDIFPLDYLNIDSFEEDKQRITESVMRSSIFMRRGTMDLTDKAQLERYNRYYTDNPMDEYENIQKIASNPSYCGSDNVANCVMVALKSSAQIWKASWFEKTIMHQFETTEIPMPGDIVPRLEAQYGDYMQYPPVEQRGNWHSDILWDPDKSYKEYI